MTATLEIESKSKGSVALPAKLLLEIFKLLNHQRLLVLQYETKSPIQLEQRKRFFACFI